MAFTIRSGLVLFAAVLLSAFLLGCNSSPPQPTAASGNDIGGEGSIFGEDQAGTLTIPDGDEIKYTKNGTKYIVDPAKIRGGGPPQDGIPSIDNPIYVAQEQADEWIEDDELVLALIRNDVKRVYPLQILVWHEIVNDIVGEEPIVITYCPLCGSGIAYKRTLDGNAVEFGTSGKLYNSNLVMYDRESGTWWTQIDGKAIVGERTGEELEEVSIDTVTWGEWKAVHDDAQVLSRTTGYVRSYGQDPYGSYYEDTFVMFPVENRDDRIHPKTVIFGIEVDGAFQAYREDDLKKQGIIEDSFNGLDLRVVRDQAGIVTITNLENGEEIVKERGFWFAWYAFHPETTLYLP